jgi:hypothetical protein
MVSSNLLISFALQVTGRPYQAQRARLFSQSAAANNDLDSFSSELHANPAIATGSGSGAQYGTYAHVPGNDDL